MGRSFGRGKNLTKDTLLAIATVGAAIIAGSSPRFYHSVARQFFKDKIREMRRARARKLAELEKKKVILFRELGDGRVRVELTHRGKSLVRLYNLENIKLTIPKKWDGLWRVVMYDIPSSQRRASDAFRKKLRSLGLYQLQRSVWISPYECLAELEFLCAVFEIDINICVCYFKTREIPRESEIRKSFRL